jgi:MT0933-like antitoxin protein
MDTEGFRDRADEALTQGEEEVDERTGGRFDEQTDRAADEVRERGEGVFGDQQADDAQQEGEPQP